MEPTGAIGIIGVIAAIVSALSSGTSAFFAAYPYLFGKRTALERMSDSIRSMKSTEGREQMKKAAASVLNVEKHKDHIIEWLDNGHLLLLKLRKKIFNRLATFLVVSLAASSLIPINGQNVLFAEWTNNIEFYDVLIFLFLAVVPWLQRMASVALTEQERSFLRNLVDLENAYYQKVVEPAISAFNLEYDNFFSEYAEIRKKEVEQMRVVMSDRAV